MKNKNWTRQEVHDRLNNALFESGVIKVKSKDNGDKFLAMDSFDWCSLSVYLESEFGAEMSFDPLSGLENIPNLTVNNIVDFLVKKLNTHEQVEQIKQKKTFFHRGVYSKTKERY